MAARTPLRIDPCDYTPMVRAIALGLRGCGLDVEDLEQAGMIGLVEAAHRFDAGRGTPFEGYARRRVRGAMVDAVRDQGRTVRVPRDLHSDVKAGRTGGRFDDARKVLNASFVGDHDRGDESSLAALAVAGGTEPGGMDDPEVVAALFAELPAGDAEVVRRCLGMDCLQETPEEVADDLGTTAEVVLGVFNAAMGRLRLRIDDLDRPGRAAVAGPPAQTPPMTADPPKEAAPVSRSPRLNGHLEPAAIGRRVPKPAPPPTPLPSPKKTHVGKCPGCGVKYPYRNWCYTSACKHYRFKKGFAAPTKARPAAKVKSRKVDQPSPPLSPAFAELRAMADLAELMESLEAPARDRVLRWAGRLYRPARW